MRFLIFILGFVLAILILKYRRQIKDFTGDVAFAERMFGSGGTNTLIVFIALLVFIGSLMWSLGTLQSLLSKTVGRFF